MARHAAMRAMMGAVLLAATAANIARAMVIELDREDGPREALRTHLCSVPVLSSTSEQIPIPNYQFTMAKGGTIEADIQVEEVLDADTRTTEKYRGSEADATVDVPTKGRRSTTIQFRRKHNIDMNYQDHYSWVQLFQNLLKWAYQSGKRGDRAAAKEKLKGPNSAEGAETLDNVYLMLLTRAQWDLYLSSEPDKQIQPSNNERKFVYNSQIMAAVRIPITTVGDTVKFTYTAKENDRFVLMVFNTDERKLILTGRVALVNPGGDHLPVEMKYYTPVVAFWEAVFAASGVAAVIYLLIFYRRKAKVVNYMLAANFLLVAAYLHLDRALLNSITTTGTYTNILWTTAHLVKRLHENFLLATLVLLALGWKMLRENLTGMEFRMVLSVCAFSCVVGFIEILINGMDVSRYVVRTVAFIAILIATNFNTIIIRSRVIDESLDVQAGIAYAQMNAYNMFRITFFAFIFKPVFYSALRTMCLQATAEENFVWDEHFMLFLDLLFDYVMYWLYFRAFMPISQLPLFKHLFATRPRLE